MVSPVHLVALASLCIQFFGHTRRYPTWFGCFIMTGSWFKSFCAVISSAVNSVHLRSSALQKVLAWWGGDMGKVGDEPSVKAAQAEEWFNPVVLVGVCKPFIASVVWEIFSVRQVKWRVRDSRSCRWNASTSQTHGDPCLFQQIVQFRHVRCAVWDPTRRWRHHPHRLQRNATLQVTIWRPSRVETSQARSVTQIAFWRMESGRGVT